VSAWPPAPGWWILGGLLLFLLLLSIWLWRRYRRRAYRRAALQQLKELRDAASQGQADSIVLAELSILLRRVAISRYGRQQVAALHGDDWLAFLDRTGRTQAFAQQGRALLDAPYRRDSSLAAAPLLELAQHWLRVQS
jgi:hypothetical protein